MSQASYLIVAEFKDKLPFIVAASFSLESLKGYLHNKPTKWEEQRRTLWRDPCDSVMFNPYNARLMKVLKRDAELLGTVYEKS